MEINEVQISNEYDYSNIVPDISSVSYLVQYCNSLFQYFMNLMTEDEAKNERLKYEYREYSYKKLYDTNFSIIAKDAGSVLAKAEYKNYESFSTAIAEGHINHLGKLIIELNLSYSSGKDGALVKHENKFCITFAPYDIKFSRSSNMKDSNMDEIENNINEILKKFNVQNTIFCTK